MSVKVTCDMCEEDADGNIPENYFKLMALGRYRVTEVDCDFCVKCYYKILRFIRGE